MAPPLPMTLGQLPLGGGGSHPSVLRTQPSMPVSLCVKQGPLYPIGRLVAIISQAAGRRRPTAPVKEKETEAQHTPDTRGRLSAQTAVPTRPHSEVRPSGRYGERRPARLDLDEHHRASSKTPWGPEPAGRR